MTKIGLGVPTYNRSSYLRETLECLRAQSGDFSVLVMDNASTDDTRAVFYDTVGADSRFSYCRNESNIAALENFHACLNAMETEYFLWRADDDLSASNYLQELGASLDADPLADLAVSPFKREKVGTPLEEIELPAFPIGSFAERAVFILRNAQPTWIYGMWRRAALLANVERLRGEYQYVWASDHALMLPTFLQGKVTGCQSTWFHQRILAGATYGLTPREQLRAREQYAAYAQKVLAQFGPDFSQTSDLHSALKSHIDRHVGAVWRLRGRILKQGIRRAIAFAKGDSARG